MPYIPECMCHHLNNRNNDKNPPEDKYTDRPFSLGTIDIVHALLSYTKL